MKHYCIAGLRVAMDTYGRTASQACPYEVPVAGEPDLTIHSTAEQLRQHHPYLTVDDSEYISTGSSFYTQLLSFEGMMLHSSCVVVDEKAYLFTANSGTGKSTHTQLWLDHFGERAYILNDDKPALRFVDGVWYAYGTPWSGKYDINKNACVPVAGIAVLERGSENEICRFGGIEAVQFILNQVVRPGAAQYRIRVLEILNKLMSNVPIWKLKCNMDPEAATVSYSAMSGLNKEN